MKRTGAGIMLILVIGIAVFARVSSAYFCGFDDFGEIHRAQFEDADNLSRVFTSSHFGTTKYRPLNRLTTYVCWRIGGGSAFTFRVRNLLFHLICAICVYGLALILTREHTTALVSGLLFCLDPVANQTVVAAIFTNTIAYACLLVGLLTFLIWSESKRTIFLAFSLPLVLCGMFYYEPVIVVFPMMIGYLCLQKYRNSVAPTLKEMVAWIGGSTAVLLAYALTRHLFVRGESFRVPFLTMLHNTILYAGGLLSPIDVVTANKFFRLPLPPVTHLGEKILALLVITIAVLSVGSIAFLKTPKAQAGMQRLDKGLIAYLIFSIPIALSPFLLFTPHASETYLYLPCALYSILSVLLWAFLPTKTAYRLK